MTYRDRETGRLFSSWARVRAARGGTSLPTQPTPQIEAAVGVDRIVTPLKPVASNGEKAVKSSPRQQPDGTWAYEWSVVALSGDELAEDVAKRKSVMSDQARQAFNDTLAAGFTDASGVTWSTASNARQRIMDLTQRIQEFRAGKMASALPNGKNTVKLRDANETPHDVGPDGIVALAEQGSDFQDQAEDRLEQLLADITAATSHADLDAIDVTAGWP